MLYTTQVLAEASGQTAASDTARRALGERESTGAQNKADLSAQKVGAQGRRGPDTRHHHLYERSHYSFINHETSFLSPSN